MRVIPLTDFHCGLRVGLMPPKVVENEGTPYEIIHKQNSTQKMLWKKYTSLRNKLVKEPFILLLLSDFIHGIKNPTENWSSSYKAQKDCAVQCITQYSSHKNCQKTYMVRGSKYHVGENNGLVEDQIAQEVGAHKHHAFMKMEIEVEGVRIAVQHKGPKPGSRAWTRENAMRNKLKDVYFRALEEGRQPADLYLWGHFHEYIFDTFKEITGVVLPAWCTPNEYALEHVGYIETSDYGLVYFEVEDGAIRTHKAFDTFDAVERVQHG